MTNYIWITTRKEMYHRYPEAPAEVEFLRNVHRHIFHFKVFIEVFTDDRDIEFIMFKRFVERILDGFEKFEGMSCEMISDIIHNNTKETYPNRKMKIEVSEDGENGIQFEYNR